MRAFRNIVLAIVLTVFTVILAGCGNSSAGVTIIGDNEALLPTGETFALLHVVNKRYETWLITYDGKDTVHFECTHAICFDKFDAPVPALGQVTDVEATWMNHFYLSRRSDGTVSVKWPWGWNYLPPR